MCSFTFSSWRRLLLQEELHWRPVWEWEENILLCVESQECTASLSILTAVKVVAGAVVFNSEEEENCDPIGWHHT